MGSSGWSKKKDEAFLKEVLDLSKRGDFVALSETFKDFWKDNTKNPWHRIDRIAARYYEDSDDEELVAALLHIRAATYACIDMLSLSMAIDSPSKEIRDIILTQDTWKVGKREAREHLALEAKSLIEKNRVYHIVPNELKRDGLGYLTKKVREVQIENYRKAKPSVKKGKLSLKKLSRTVLGKKILRDLCIDEREIDPKGDEAEKIRQAYDHYLLEIELSDDIVMPKIQDTEQLSLDGEPVKPEDQDEKNRRRRIANREGQEDLTGYFGDEHGEESSGSETKKIEDEETE